MARQIARSVLSWLGARDTVTLCLLHSWFLFHVIAPCCSRSGLIQAAPFVSHQQNLYTRAARHLSFRANCEWQMIKRPSSAFLPPSARGVRESITRLSLSLFWHQRPFCFRFGHGTGLKFMPAASATKSERKPESNCRSDWIHVNLFLCSFLHVVIYGGSRSNMDRIFFNLKMLVA